MRDPQYPLLRRGRARRRRRVFTRSHARLLAIALLVVAVAGTATLLTLRRDPPDARRLLRDARITFSRAITARPGPMHRRRSRRHRRTGLRMSSLRARCSN
ncbi:hypothetical protein [Sphingomonas sp. Ant20]|uniref:hypothetical protein n=1 Tax=Sphingomonas sp. Ant20 TaxID=104605 RepID=UPI0005391AD9|nr:hypothetical protein [Sphingomonas sp. Ant20]KHA64030.1 hypothetical protein NI18_11975 [Sphingomonas sp. Ant20]